jgi:hypothetical protein
MPARIKIALAVGAALAGSAALALGEDGIPSTAVGWLRFAAKVLGITAGVGIAAKMDTTS